MRTCWMNQDCLMRWA